MKTTYIYLNTYKNGYLYVGAHTWDGPEGVLDPNYHGSSTIAELNKWTPIKEEILEVVSFDKNPISVECYYIVKYLKEFGISELAVKFSHCKEWANSWNRGLMLNCHANDCLHLATSKRAQLKRIETQRRTGSLQRNLSRAREAAIDTGAHKRRVATIGDFTVLNKKMLEGHCQETYKKGVAHRGNDHYKNVARSINYKESSRRMSETKRNGFTVERRIVECSGFTGSVTKVCSMLGVKSWAVWVNRKFKSGLTVVERDNLKFTLIK